MATCTGPCSALNVDPPHVLASHEDPPKSDRSHYPKYKPLVFPAAQHGSSNPEYNGPLIETPRIQPRDLPSPVPGTAQCMADPSEACHVSAPTASLPLLGIADFPEDAISYTGQSCKSREGQPVPRTDGRSLECNDRCMTKQHMQSKTCGDSSDMLSASDPGEGVDNAAWCYAKASELQRWQCVLGQCVLGRRAAELGLPCGCILAQRPHALV